MINTTDAVNSDGQGWSESGLGLTGLTSATIQMAGWDNGSRSTSGTGQFRIGAIEGFGTVQSAANNNSVLSVPATSAFGRVMSGSSQTVAVSNVGDATTFSASATGGFSPSATGSVTADGSSNLSIGVGSTLGSRSGTLTLNNTAPDSNAAGQGSAQAPITSSVSATVVQNRSVDVGTVAGTDHGGIDLGRQMLGTVTGTHQITSTGSDAENTRLTFRGNANNTFTGYANTGLAQVVGTNADEVDVVLDGTNTTANVGYSLEFTQTGARANDAQFIQFTTTNAFNGEGLAGETPLSAQSTPGTNQMRIYIQNATIVDNREISASGVDLGSVLVGSTTGAQTTTLSTTGDDDNNTRVTVNGTSASNEGVTIAAGTAQLFDNASATTTRSITGNFATSGSKNVNVNFNVTGEGLANESVNAVTVNATADVYQAAALSANNSSPIANNGSVTLSNAATSDGGQRAAAEIVSRQLTGLENWSVDGLSVGSTIEAGSSATGTASLDTEGLLSGTHRAELTVGLEHADQSIAGTEANDLGTFSWSLSETIVATGGGVARVQAGQALADFNASRGEGVGKGTQLSFLAGTLSEARDLAISFADAPTTGGRFFSDVVTVTGLTGERFVMSLTYDDVLAGDLQDQMILGWLDNNGAFVNAVDGNIGTNDVNLDIPFQGSWADYQFTNDVELETALGAFGVDIETNTVWAVIDHNSDFSVIPEPSTYAVFIGLLVFALILLRRRMKV